MTYHRTFAEAQNNSYFANVTPQCFNCNEAIDGPTVVYDGYPTADGFVKHVYMHRDCAFAMANRMILDAWPNRTDADPIQTHGVR